MEFLFFIKVRERKLSIINKGLVVMLFSCINVYL